MTGSTRRGVFDGIRVLDFSRVVAGPFATRLLADQGAEVIKIEEPPLGDLGRVVPVLRDGESSYFAFLNYGKQSLCLDLRQERGRVIARDLARHCDVVVENFRPGVMDRLGIGYEILRADNPRVIFCSVTGYGQTSPYRDWPFQAPVGHAMSGQMSLTGWVNGQGPLAPGFYLADTNAGGYAYGAIVTALFDRERTGRGTWIDLSMLDALFFLIGSPAEHVAQVEGAYQTSENRQRVTTVPSAIVEGVDGLLFVGGGVDNVQWQRLCRVMGRPELADHPDFAGHAGRVERRVEVEGLIQAWLLQFDTVAEAERLLNESGVMAGRVRTVDEAVHDPHFAARGMVIPRPAGDPGPGLRTGSPFRFSESQSGPAGPAPALGADNAAVLKSILGFGDEQIAALRADGVVRGV